MRRLLSLAAFLGALCLSPAGAPAQDAALGTPLAEEIGELRRPLELDGARGVLIAPLYARTRPATLIVFACPNGNTAEETLGRNFNPGESRRYGIQHILAQHRRLRQECPGEAFVLAVIEADGKSWPSWRRTQPDANARILGILESVVAASPLPIDSIELSGHSGGGSFLFGYLNALPAPDPLVHRLVFLDSNYAFSAEDGHGEKLSAWLHGDAHNRLVVLSYDDGWIQLNGKLVLSKPEAGTWCRTEAMRVALARTMAFEEVETDRFVRFKALDGRVDLIQHRNPENKILHTVMVGDWNGYLFAHGKGRWTLMPGDLFVQPAIYGAEIDPAP